jgi:hypothetical protein
MIEVRIRHELEPRAVRLCEWDPTNLDGVVRMLADEGVRDGGGDQYAALDSFTTQIVVEDGAAFFEVVIMEQSE